MGRVHGIREDHRLVRLDLVHQSLVLVDEGRLFRRVELARDRLGLAVLHVQAMQQRDQSRPGRATARPHAREIQAPIFAGSARQGRGNPGFQRICLVPLSAGRRCLHGRVRHSLSMPSPPIVREPRPDRIVVDEQHPGCRLTGHAVIRKQDGAGPASQTVRS